MLIENQQDDLSNNSPWTEKYWPKTLNDLIANDHITSTLNSYLQNKNLPNLLFYGAPGTGKTSTIVACAW